MRVNADVVEHQAPAGENAARANSAGDADGENTANIKDSADNSRFAWTRMVAFGVLPVLALLLAAAAGFLKWQDTSIRGSDVAAQQSVRAATDSTVALLSYGPETVEKDLEAARNRLTGNFRDSYSSLIRDIVIPGSLQKQISAVATVPAAASVSASPNHAVVLVFVNQTTTIGADAPSDSASTVRVTMDKVGEQWLISQFDPI